MYKVLLASLLLTLSSCRTHIGDSANNPIPVTKYTICEIQDIYRDKYQISQIIGTNIFIVNDKTIAEQDPIYLVVDKDQEEPFSCLVLKEN